MEAVSAREGYELWRPNREKAQSKTTKAIVAFVLLVSAGLIAIIVLGGWERMQSSSIAIMSLVWAGALRLRGDHDRALEPRAPAGRCRRSR